MSKLVEVRVREEVPITPAGRGRPDYSASIIMSGGNSLPLFFTDIIPILEAETYRDYYVYTIPELNPDKTGVVPNGVYDIWTYVYVAHETNSLIGAYLTYKPPEGKEWSYLAGLGYGTVILNPVNDTYILKPGTKVYLRLQNLAHFDIGEIIVNMSGKRSLVSTEITDKRLYGAGGII